MLKGEAENMVRRAIEDLQGEMASQQGDAAQAAPVFTDAQVQVLASVCMRICGRMIEEALASWRPGVPGSKPSFFTD